MSTPPPATDRPAPWGPIIAGLVAFALVVAGVVGAILYIHGHGIADNSGGTNAAQPQGPRDVVNDPTGRFVVVFPQPPTRHDTTTITASGTVQHSAYTLTAQADLGTVVTTVGYSAGYTIYPQAVTIGDPATFLTNAMQTQIGSVHGTVQGTPKSTTLLGRPALEFTIAVGGGYGRTALVLRDHTLYEIEVFSSDPTVPPFDVFLGNVSLLP